MLMRISENDSNELVWERRTPQGFTPEHALLQEQTFRVQHPLLELEGYAISLEGLHLTYSTWQQHQNIQAKLKNESPYVEMHFNLSGNHAASLKGGSYPMAFSAKEHNLFYLPSIEEVFETTKQKEPAQALRIKFTQSYFLNLAQREEAFFLPLLKAIDQKQLALLRTQNGRITRQMNTIVEAILQCNKEGLLKRLFLEAKVLDLLLLQIESFFPLAPTQSSIKEYDVEKLYQAKHIIEQHLANPYSLRELSRQVGLNEFKLKKGFKTLFGYSVFGYLHELRMQEAKRLLLDHKKSIEQVAHYCGYQYVQHFSTAFKKKYGTTPGSIRR
jgi:AraC-like DNA-binding protein